MEQNQNQNILNIGSKCLQPDPVTTSFSQCHETNKNRDQSSWGKVCSIVVKYKGDPQNQTYIALYKKNDFCTYGTSIDPFLKYNPRDCPDPFATHSHAYLTVQKSIESNFGPNIHADVLPGKRLRATATNGIDIWPHHMFQRIEDTQTQNVRFFSLTDIVNCNLMISRSHNLIGLDNNREKELCAIDYETIVLIQRAYSMGLLSLKSSS